MTGQQHDPEVERLASDVLEGAEAYYCGPGYATCGSVGVSFNNARDIARAVLADLRARYILVPRDGATETIDWGVRVEVERLRDETREQKRVIKTLRATLEETL